MPIGSRGWGRVIERLGPCAIDTGKNVLHVIGLDEKGAVVLRERVSRSRIAARLVNVPRCLIGIASWLRSARGQAAAGGLCQAVSTRPTEASPRAR
jgi:hypothetical protein